MSVLTCRAAGHEADDWRSSCTEANSFARCSRRLPVVPDPVQKCHGLRRTAR